MINNVDEVHSLGHQETYTPVIILMIWDMDMDKCIGQKDQFTKDSGLKGCSMEKVKFGKEKNF